MTILNATARATLRAAGITPSEWARRNWSANGTWSGDVCGCPDNRCANGFHHMGADDCGCLPTLLGELLNGDRHHAFAPSLSEAWDIIAAASKLHARVALRDADGKHFDICAICCTSGPDRRRTKECEDDHQHAPWPAPRCPTAHVLSGGKPGE